MASKSEREQNSREIKVREELLKRLEYPYRQLEKAGQKEIDKRKAYIDSIKQYNSYEEAHEAYGWGMIDDDKLRAVEKFFNDGEEYIEAEISIAEYAQKMLGEIIAFQKLNEENKEGLKLNAGGCDNE